MSDNYQAGAFAPVQFQVLGQGQVALLNVTGHNLDDLIALIDVSGTRHAGLTARLAAKADAAGTVNAEFDADNPPYLNPPNIRKGVSGILLAYYSALSLGRPFQVPVIIEKVHYETSVAAESKWSFDWRMNAIAGVFVYPSQ